MVRKAAKKAASPSSVIYPEGCESIDPETNNSTLVLALKGLYERMSEDETTTADNYESLASHLVSSQLINKPADVAVYVALCLARIFIICPTNPFDLKHQELRDALEFLAKSIGRIRCESEALYTRYHSLLEMVSNSGILQQNLKQLDSDTDDGARVIATLLKSAALVVEVRKAAERVQEENNEQDVERKIGVRTMIMNICRGVFEENADHIHPIALDVIFSHLISPEKGNNPEAYHFMRKIVEQGAVYIHQSVLRIFVEACQTQDDPKLDTDVFKLVGKRKAAVYELLSELSDVLSDIRIDLLSLLSTKLTSSEMEVRLMALKTSSEVAKNRSDLPESCPTLWQKFIDRSKDGSPIVRKEFAEKVREPLYTHHDMRSTIWDVLNRLVTDQDEEVRMAAIETVCLTARKKLEAVNEKLIESCTERLRDKKTEVRKVALRHLLAMYKDIVKKEESTKSDRGSVAIIAKKVIMMYRGTDNQKGMTEEKVIIEKGLICSILPMELPMRRRMELLVELSSRLSAPEFKLLSDMLQRVVTGRKFLSTIMDCISIKKDGEPRKEKSQEEKKKHTEMCIEKLVNFFPHHQKAEVALRKFTNLLCMDNESVRQMEIILRKETTVIGAQSAVKQLLSRVASSKDEISKEQEEIIRSLVSRLAPLLIDHTSLLELSRHLRDIIDGDSIGKEEACRIINRAISIYKVLADLYPSSLNQREIIDILLTKFLENDNDIIVKNGLQCIHSMLAKEAGVDGVNVRDEKWREKMKKCLLQQIKEGKPASAKHALRDLCHLLGQKESWDELREHLEGLLDNLDHTEDDTARSLVVLRKAVTAWKEPLLDRIMAIYPLEIARKILVPDPLTYNGGETSDVNASDAKTLEDLPVSHSMKNTLAAIKLAVRVLPLFPHGDHSTALISKTINVFSVCAFERGNVVDNITEADAAWLTAMSGSALVRLMTNRRISRDFCTPSLMTSLAQVATHPLDSVRLYFINRVFKYFKYALLIGPFVSLIPLSLMGLTRGIDVDEEERIRRHTIEIFTTSVLLRHNSLHGKRVDDILIKCETFVPHLVVLLAETPTLTDNNDEEELTKIAEVIWNCLDPLVNRIRGSVNWELVCALLNQLKVVLPRIKEKSKDDNEGREERDNEKKTRMMNMAKKVWAISEIFLHLIVYKAKIPMGTPEKAPLLLNFFEPRKGDNNVIYAPKSLLKRIEEGRIQHDFIKLKISTTMVKEESKKDIKAKGRGRRKVVKKNEESENEDTDEDEEEIKMPSTSRRGQKAMETLEEEDEDDDMEIDYDEKKPLSARGKLPINRRITSMRELESIDLSPIGGGTTRKERGLAASTPIVKNGIGRGGAVGVGGGDTPKKRGRPSSVPSVSPIKLATLSPIKSSVKSPAKSPPKAGPMNGSRKRSSKKEESDEEEEEEEEKMPLPAKRGRGRVSKKENGKEEPKKGPSTSTKGRGKKKIDEEEEEEKEDSEEEKDEKVEQPPPKRRGRPPSIKKSIPPPPVVRKTSSRKKK